MVNQGFFFEKFSGNPVRGVIKTSMKMFIYERERSIKNFVF